MQIERKMYKLDNVCNKRQGDCRHLHSLDFILAFNNILFRFYDLEHELHTSTC